MPAVDRSYWLAVGIASYLGIASAQRRGFELTNLVLLVLGPLLLLLAWRWTRVTRVEDTTESAARRAARVTATACVCWLHARLGPAGTPFMELAATLAAGSAAVGCTYSLARIAPVGGLIAPVKGARSVDAAAFTALLWGVALAVVAKRLIAPESAPRLDPLTLDYAATAASIGSLLVIFAAAWRVRVLRQLELGVTDRAEAAVALSITALSVAVPLAAIRVAPPDRVLPAALFACALGCHWTVLARDAEAVSSAMRGTVAIMILGVPSVLAVGILTHQLPQYAAPIALAGASLSILAGLIARDVARPLGPERSRWLDGIAKASQNALVPEPTMALSASLLALKRMFRDPSATPELWRLEPAAVLSVDVAGYMHEAPAELPAGICELGLEEPERTLRHDTLKALEVHRPSVRPLLAWFEVHKAFCATVVEDEDGPVGFLLLPRGGRRQTLTIEEAHALRGLADRIGALFAINSTLARSRARESELVTRVGNLERDLSKASDVIAGQAERQREFAGTLARPARAHNYSAAAKLAFTELEQRARRAESTLLSAPVGVDVLAWAAAFHRSSPRANGPFICVDAPSLPVQSDGTPPPWHWAWGGTVFIRDIKCLATELQADLVDRLAREPAANTELAPPIVLGSINPPQVSAEVSASAGDPLFALFRRPPLALPALMERPEDLRSLVLDALARRGRGREPLGIERHALQLLMDHEWPGNERELYDVLERAAQIATGTLVDTDDLAAVGFRPAQAGSPAMPPNEGEPGGESVFPRLPSGPPRRRSRAPRARPRGS